MLNTDSRKQILQYRTLADFSIHIRILIIAGDQLYRTDETTALKTKLVMMTTRTNDAQPARLYGLPKVYK